MCVTESAFKYPNYWKAIFCFHQVKGISSFPKK